VQLAVDQTCDSSVAMTVKVSVSDPNNLPVDIGNATSTVTPDDTGVRTTVTVTPTLAGPYHFVGRFEPNLGVAQADILVARDRGTETPDVTIDQSSALGGCHHLDLTPSSRVLCLSPTVELFETDGGGVQTLGPQQAGYIDGVLWMLDTTTGDVTRWVEAGDAGFARTPDTSFSFPLSTSVQLLPTADDVVLFDSNNVISRITATDAGLAAGGGGVLTGFSGEFDLAWHGGTDVVGLGMQNVCTFSFVVDAGFNNCTFQNGISVAGLDSSGVWGFDTTFGSVLTAFNSTRTSSLDVPSGATPVPYSSPGFGLGTLFESGPVMALPDLTREIVSLNDHGFALDTIAKSASVVSVTSTAITVSDGLQLKVYRR
jgi:hypothetical protein